MGIGDYPLPCGAGACYWVFHKSFYKLRLKSVTCMPIRIGSKLMVSVVQIHSVKTVAQRVEHILKKWQTF